MAQELGEDPLPEYKDGQCTITHAIRRGPTFVEPSVELCTSCCLLAQKGVEQLVNEDIGDDAFTAFIRRITKTHPTVDLSGVMTECARKGYVSSMAQLYKLKPTGNHPIILLVIETTESHPELEKKYLQLLQETNPDLYSPQFTLDGENALHIAAAQGFTDLAKQILVRGYTNLLWAENKNHMYPIQTAVETEHFRTAEVLLRSTKDRVGILKLFKQNGKMEPRISLYTQLEKLVKWQGNEEKAKEVLQFILAVLDIARNEDHDHELLDQCIQSGTSCYDFIAEKRLTEIQEHESFSTLVDQKWKEYGAAVQSIPLTFHLMFMALLTAILVLAAKSKDPSDYSLTIDWVRLSLEVVTIIWVLVDFGSTLCTLLNVCKKNWDKIQPTHIMEWNNVLDVLAIMFTLLIIPPRAFNNDWQWVFAALAYIFQGLRIFKHAVMIEPVGIYVAVLLLVMKRDLLRFLLLFSVLIISFGGGFYLALRGEIISNGSSDSSIIAGINSSSNASINSGSNASDFDPVNDTSLGLFPHETREIYYVWLTGFRILAEGSVIGYCEHRGFSWLGVIIYWLLLFIVGILLLNILVAQFIHSYDDEAGRARLNVTLTRTKLLLNMDKSYWAKHIRKWMKSKTWPKKIVEFLSSLFGNEGEQNDNKEKFKTQEHLQALEDSVQGVDTLLRTQIQVKLDKQEERLNALQDEVHKLATDLESLLRHLKVPLKSNS